MLQLSHLRKRYGRQTVLEDVELSIPAGSLNVLIGSNGTGKSTLLRLISQLERPTAGSVLLDGSRPAVADIGYLPQDLHFHPLLEVAEILEFYGDCWQRDRAAVQAALLRWGLQPHAEKRTAALSGGLRQRLGLAVLALRPARLLLLDEPGLSLDPHWREELRQWLLGRARAGVTVLVTTHLAAEWQGSADRFLACEGGRIDTVGASSAMAPSGSARIIGGNQ